MERSSGGLGKIIREQKEEAVVSVTWPLAHPWRGIATSAIEKDDGEIIKSSPGAGEGEGGR